MDPLSLFGLCAVSLMLAAYALEARGPRFTLLFAGACALGSTYGFLQGAWPFGLVEAIWAMVAVAKWRGRVRPQTVVQPSTRGDSILMKEKPPKSAAFPKR